MRHLPMLDAQPSADVQPADVDALSDAELDALIRHERPTHRAECLTAHRRYEVAVMYAPNRARVPEAAGVDAQNRPTDGGPDGWNAARPCPYLRCKWHLAIDYNAVNGTLSLPYGSRDDEDDAPEGASSEVPPEVRFAAQAEATVARLLHIQAGLAQWEHVQQARLAGTGDGKPAERFPPPYLHTCALDLADIGHETDGLTLEAVGEATNRTRERVRQVQGGALGHLKTSRHVHGLAARDGEDAHPLGDACVAPRTHIVLPSGAQIPVIRASGSSLIVACENPVCGAHFTIREPRLLKVGYAHCKSCRGARVAPPARDVRRAYP